MVFLFPVLMKMLLSHLAPFASRSQKRIYGLYIEKSHRPNSRHFPRNLNFGPRIAPHQAPLGQGQSLHFLGASWLWENMCSLVSGPEMGWRWSRGWRAAEVRTLPLFKLWSSKQPFWNACRVPASSLQLLCLWLPRAIGKACPARCSRFGLFWVVF